MAMMFRGIGKPTDQLDIQLAQASDPFGISTAGMGTSPYVPAPQAAPAKEKFGFRDVIGILGEALGGALGQGPGAYTQGKLMERQMAQKSAAQQAQRQADWEDWVQKQIWQRDNPAPQALSDFERTLIGSGIQPGTPEWQQAFVTRRDNQLDPWTNIVVGGNSVSGRQSAVQRAIEGGGGLSSPQAGGAAIPPTAPVGKLRPLGGGTPSASSGFR